MDNCTTVFIADNSEEFCSQLAAEMQKCQGFQIVGTATDGEQTLRALAELRPEVLVLDMMLPKRDGISVLKALMAMENRPATLATSGFITEFVATTAANLGVRYLMLKPCDIPALVERLEEMRFGAERKTVPLNRSDKTGIETMVTNIIHEIGVPAHIKGYQYLREAIVLVVNDMDTINAVMQAQWQRGTKWATDHAKGLYEEVKELADKLTVAENSEEVLDYSGDIPATDAQMRVYTAQSMNSDSTTLPHTPPKAIPKAIPLLRTKWSLNQSPITSMVSPRPISVLTITLII